MKSIKSEIFASIVVLDGGVNCVFRLSVACGFCLVVGIENHNFFLCYKQKISVWYWLWVENHKVLYELEAENQKTDQIYVDLEEENQ